MPHSRSTNQHYGKFFEKCIVAQINKTTIPQYNDYNFTEKEKINIFNQAKTVADYFINHTAIWIGNKTALQNGDIQLEDDTTIEIKYVSSGSGTYCNTTIYYFDTLGFNFKEYMEKFGLYDAIDQTGIISNRRNNSPVNQNNSSIIRHNYSEYYENVIKPIDIKMRQQFVKDIYNFFEINPEQLLQFYKTAITKEIANKQPADVYCVYNYNNNTFKIYTIPSADEVTSFYTTDLGFVINGVRFAFSWQNGAGLNNPTIRVFLPEKED